MPVSLSALAVPDISRDAADRVTRLVKRHAGIDIPLEKTDLLRNRLGPRLRALNLRDFDAYLTFVAGPNGNEEIPLLIEALTTHTTSFFREDRQYRWLASDGLPPLLAQGAGSSRDLVVWSAACSTGAELWSAAMLVEDVARRAGARILYKCYGTDISRQILARAEAAVYAPDEIEGIPEAMRTRYLLRSKPGKGGPNGALFRIAPELRSRATFFHANLFSLERVPRFQADVAFLRNVLIYFDRDDQTQVVQAVTKRIRPGGYLLTGHAEALFERPAGFVQVGSSIYQREV